MVEFGEGSVRTFCHVWCLLRVLFNFESLCG